MSQPWEGERSFATYLRELARRAEEGESSARASLAALRRGLGKSPGEVAEAARVVFPMLRTTASDREVDAHWKIAGLFAIHRLSWESDGARLSNLGASFWRLAHREGQREDEGAERRFVALLNAHTEELDRHLRHAVSLLKAHDIPIDWAQLLRDVQEWTYEDRRVQRDWARAFWGSRQAAASDTAEAGTAEPDGEAAAERATAPATS